MFTPFCDQVAELLSAADLVVSRAGAGTIAELIRCATPAILVPYPQAADNHQAANAAFFERIYLTEEGEPTPVPTTAFADFIDTGKGSNKNTRVGPEGLEPPTSTVETRGLRPTAIVTDIRTRQPVTQLATDAS